ncbi:MAG: hypothetical protein JW997_04535 [Actinobacteria bacterium]|nr:hypothetical protein [Actinomycetota bacterium]
MAIKKSLLLKKPTAKGFIFFAIAALLMIACTPLLVCCTNNASNDNSEQLFKEGPPEIENVVLCKNVDEDFAPLEPTDIFAQGTNSIYLSVQFKNFTDKNSLKVIWSYQDTGNELATQVFTPDRQGSGYYSFNIKISTSFPPGNYNAKVYFDQKQVKSLDFKIE